jgi:glucose/mannose-6-phosphate isomerase
MIAVLTTGGLLEEVARLNEIPMLVLPGGLQPRAAIGFSFVPLVMFLEKVKLIKDAESRVKTAIAALQSWRDRMVEDQPDSANPAKQLAQLLHGRIPIIYGGPRLTDMVAMRWKTQICENAKMLAFSNVYPEFNHNEICGWSKLTQDQKDSLIVINLRSADDHDRIAARMDAVKRLIEEQDVMVIDLWAAGETRLERMFNLIQMGDFVSYYLAILNELDPTPVDAIENLKKELASGGSEAEVSEEEAAEPEIPETEETEE